MKEPTSLADRYRRLLAWYPRDHRERHGEEMLGVLLAGAGERTRPSRRETIDLLRAALHLHLRRVVGADGGIDHRDVLAIVSLLGPIALLAGAAPIAHTVARLARTGSIDLLRVFMVNGPAAALMWMVWFVVAVLSLFRARRAAAVGAWLGTFGLVLVRLLHGLPIYWDSLLADAGTFLLGLVVAIALTWSPGPTRGWDLVGGRRVAVLVAAVGTSMVLVMKSFGSFNVLSLPFEAMTRFPGLTALWFLALAVLVAGAVVAGGVRTREGRRAALVLSVPVVVSVLTLVLPTYLDARLVLAIGYGVPVVALLGLGSLPRRVRLSHRD